MDNFKAYNPTGIFFGKDVLNNLGKKTKEFGKRALLIYGKGSIKKSGVYQQVMAQLESVQTEVFEYSGIKSNPVFEDVDAAAKLARENNVDVIIAVGGGSVIDSAKMVSITAKVNHSSWDFLVGMATPKTALPLISVLTLAATGSEMNPYAVIQNDKTKQNIGYGHPLCFARYSFLDPAFTLTVPKNYTAYGIADIMAHCFEAYFGKGDAELTDSIITAIIKETMTKGLKLIDDLGNYDLRADIMLASTMALNGMTFYGKSYGDWGAHNIGHELSSLYDIPHGASLSIVYPAWFKLHKKRIPEKIKKLGVDLFGAATVDETINAFEKFYKSIGTPVRLSEYISPVNKIEIVGQLRLNKVNGSCCKISENDYVELVELMID